MFFIKSVVLLAYYREITYGDWDRYLPSVHFDGVHSLVQCGGCCLSVQPLVDSFQPIAAEHEFHARELLVGFVLQIEDLTGGDVLEVEILAILTGLEIDAAKSGVKPDLSNDIKQSRRCSNLHRRLDLLCS